MSAFSLQKNSNLQVKRHFQQPRKVSIIMKKPQPLHLKNSQSFQKPLTPLYIVKSKVISLHHDLRISFHSFILFFLLPLFLHFSKKRSENFGGGVGLNPPPLKYALVCGYQYNSAWSQLFVRCTIVIAYEVIKQFIIFVHQSHRTQ